MSDQNKKKDGYIYLMSNPYIKGVLKIGRSVNPVTRAIQLQTTGVPEPFKIEFAIYVEDAVEVEKAVHESLVERRVSGNREFFEVGFLDAIGEISSAMCECFCIVDEIDFINLKNENNLLRRELVMRSGPQHKSIDQLIQEAPEIATFENGLSQSTTGRN